MRDLLNSLESVQLYFFFFWKEVSFAHMQKSGLSPTDRTDCFKKHIYMKHKAFLSAPGLIESM